MLPGFLAAGDSLKAGKSPILKKDKWTNKSTHRIKQPGPRGESKPRNRFIFLQRRADGVASNVYTQWGDLMGAQLLRWGGGGESLQGLAGVPGRRFL